MSVVFLLHVSHTASPPVLIPVFFLSRSVKAGCANTHIHTHTVCKVGRGARRPTLKRTLCFYGSVLKRHLLVLGPVGSGWIWLDLVLNAAAAAS